MKNTLLILLSLAPLFCFAQSLARSVNSTAGYIEANGNFHIHATVGQPIAGTLQTSYGDLRQGFQQPLVGTQSSIIEQEGVSLSIYPNPTSGEFTLRINSPLNDKVSLSVIDVTGKEVIKEDVILNSGIFPEEFSLEGYSRGMYTVIVYTFNEAIKERIILQ